MRPIWRPAGGSSRYTLNAVIPGIFRLYFTNLARSLGKFSRQNRDHCPFRNFEVRSLAARASLIRPPLERGILPPSLAGSGQPCRLHASDLSAGGA